MQTVRNAVYRLTQINRKREDDDAKLSEVLYNKKGRARGQGRTSLGVRGRSDPGRGALCQR